MIVFFLCLPALLMGTEMAPWFGRDKEFEFRASYAHRWGDRLHTYVGDVSYIASDHVGSIGVSISPVADWSGEVEVIAADTELRSLGFDSIAVTVRYLFFNDIVGDPFSVVMGVTMRVASDLAVKDPSRMLHGEFESEMHLALGREKSVEDSWGQRFWGAFFFGLSNQGSGWVALELDGEKNFCDRHQLRAFSRGRLGLGLESLDLTEDFQGYGKIAYRTVEVGAAYRYVFDYLGHVELAYSYLPYARYYLDGSHRVAATYLFPFGI